MNESLVGLLSAMALLISAVSGIYVTVTTARHKRAEADDLYSQINKRIQDQYEQLLKQKNHRIENLDIRTGILEAQMQTEREEKRRMLDYISYLLQGINQLTVQLHSARQKPLFKPVDIDTYQANKEIVA